MSLLTLLIVNLPAEAPKSARAEAPTPGSHQADTSLVYSCRFEEANDQNYDGFPDFWTRATGPRYPLYVKAEIVPVASPDSDRSLRGFLDGGSLALSTPEIPITPFFSYQATVWVRSRGIENNRIFLAVTLLDSARRPLTTIRSQERGETPEWTLLSVGPFDVDESRVSAVILSLHVEAAARADVKAEVWFGAVSLRRLPSFKVQLDRPEGLYPLGHRPKLICRISGVLDTTDSLELTIRDALGATVLRENLPITIKPLFSGDSAASEPSLRGLSLSEASAEFELPLDRPGFYRVKVTLPGPEGLSRTHTLRLAILHPVSTPVPTTFGWTLDPQATTLGFSPLQEVIREAQIGYLKFPVWSDSQIDRKTLQESSAFLEHLASRGVHVVGLLVPPQSLREQVSGDATAADVLLADPKLWQPTLEFAFVRGASLIRSWQLGGDGDLEMDSEAALRNALERASSVLRTVVAETRLGIPWSGLRPVPYWPVAFVHVVARPPWTAAETETFLASLPPGGKSPDIFLDLCPLDQRDYALADRVRDLVLRMASCRHPRVAAAFHPAPFDPHTGLFSPDGSPTELFLPWRTTAAALGSAAPLGSVVLPGGSFNRVFAGEHSGVMLLWNSQPTREAVYLGENVSVRNVWGEEIPVRNTPLGQEIVVDTWPLFVFGVSIPIARWRQEASLGVSRLPSVYGVPHRAQIRWRNTFPQPVSGELLVTHPQGWVVSPSRIVFQAKPEEVMQREVLITLPFDAEAGPQPVRLDFRVLAEKTYQFSTYHFVEIGLGDVYLELLTRLEASGDLIVQQTLVNDTPYLVSFRCELFVPDRRRQLTLIKDQAPGRVVKEYRFPQGRELLGKTIWLRAEEIGGSRVLNYRTVVSE